MAEIFSDHFPVDGGLLSFRNAGGHVKAVRFSAANTPGNTVTTSERIYLTVLPPGSFILAAWFQNVGATVSGVQSTFRAETGNTQIMPSTIDLATGALQTYINTPANPFLMIPERPAHPRGERVYLVPTSNATGSFVINGIILYV